MRRARSRVAAALLTAGLAAGAGVASYRVLRRWPPGGRAAWDRVNHRGEPVTLLAGPAAAAGAVTGAALGPGIPARQRAALTVAAAGAAAFGAVDDLAGSGDRRGFRGHLGALAAGEVTTGVAKLAGIGAAGLAAAACLGGEPADLAVNAGLIAAGANLVNLFDLRPGRAIKVMLTGTGLLAAACPAARPGAAVPAGAALAVLPPDLAEQAMLGDAGANALGAALAAVAAASLPRPARVAALALAAGLTAASETVSFTEVIARHPVLNWIDMLGRRSPPAAGA
jgi:UDP-GlcNAc:undecaprenyl-phosphate GlcNAc-1-phosphate transferase